MIPRSVLWPTPGGQPPKRFLRGLAIGTMALACVAAAAIAQMPGMPAGTDFGYGARERPRQILKVEAEGGRQSYKVALGNTAFSAPGLFGARARAAGLSCNTCHVQGDINPAFFIPGVSERPGGLDPTTAFFHDRGDDGVANPLDIPTLRGVRFTAPYGRDGRFATLRDFARHVIVDEFDGPEPSPVILDALVAYMEEFEFLPNPGLDARGRLTAAADAAARRGEALFAKRFAGLGDRACATCHVPGTRFTDRQRHDVGMGRPYDTPSLLNANFTAPYYHDGRFASFEAVVAHYDEAFGLGLGEAGRRDLVAYLRALGDGIDATEPVTRQSEMSELAAYVAVLDQAISAGDRAAVALVVDTVNVTLGQIARRFDDHDKVGTGRRRPDRPDVAVLAMKLIEDMDSLGRAAARGETDAALAALQVYRARARQLVSSYPQGG